MGAVFTALRATTASTPAPASMRASCTSAALLAAVREREARPPWWAGPVEDAELVALPLDEELVTGSAPWLASLDDIVAMVPLKMVFHAGCTYRLHLEALLAARGAFGVRRLEFGTLDGIIGCVGAGVGVTLLPAPPRRGPPPRDGWLCTRRQHGKGACRPCWSARRRLCLDRPFVLYRPGPVPAGQPEGGAGPTSRHHRRG